MSSTQPHAQGAFITIFDSILERPLGPNLLWIFALEMNRYMSVHGLDKKDIAQVAVKNKRNAADHPAKRVTDRPVWIDGVGWHLDTAYWTNRDLYYPRYVEYAARMAYDMAGIREPRKEINIAEAYDPFDYKELHHLEGLLLFDKGKAPEAMKDGVLNRDGDLPSTPSGGLLGVGNPIATTARRPGPPWGPPR